jgi:tetratricopeptide (TPR) repeat protein
VLKHAFILVTLAAGFLSGCSITPSHPPSSLEYAPVPSTYQRGELNGETLFDLLVAELAGHEQAYDLSFQKYLKQAELTGDPAIIRRATRIAQFNKDTQGLEKASKIWAKYEPNSSEPDELLAGLFMHQGRFEEAVPYINNALSNNGRQVLLLMSAQARNLSPAQAKALIEPLQQQLASNAQQADIWLTLGILQRQALLKSDALTSFTQALSINPDAYEASIQKADLLRETGKTTSALAILNGLLKKQPDNKQIKLLKVQTLYKAERPANALALSETLMADHPDDEQLQLYLALLALDFNRLDDSENMLREIIKQSTNTAPYFYLGLIAEQQNRNEAAIRNYLRVDEGKNVIQAYTRAVGLMENIDNQERVSEAIVQGIEQQPSIAPILINLHADWLRKHGLNAEAIDKLNQGVELYPDNLDLRYMRAMMLPEEDFPIAEQDFRIILEQDPDNAMALNALGYTLSLYTQRYQEAYELLSRAIQLKPNDPAVIDSMGWVLYKLNRLDEAESYLSKAYQSFSDAEVGSHLVIVLAAQQKTQQARALLTELEKKFPNSPHLSDAQNALKGI